MLTVRQLSRLAGITPRTLHHYDAIGLLKPSRIGDNGYRYYAEDAVLRLQQILFYRELDMQLDEIKKIISRRDFDVVGALEGHKKALGDRVARLDRLIQTVDITLEYLKGEKQMSSQELFNGFTEEEQEKYALEAEQKYDVETVQASNKKWKAYSKKEKDGIMAEGKNIYISLIAAMPRGADHPQVRALIARWHRHIENFWSPSDDQLLALAKGYSGDPRFKVNFDKLDTRLASFMDMAVKVYVDGRK
jgi:DNA-binding transcriptional MerR regulator